MPWSIFQQGGGAGAAVTWARDLLARIGAPQTPGNVQFVYDWEVSEGGGGAYNPLNQGDVPGQPGLTSTGSQYGGGAADFVSWQAGLTGAADYLQMPAYSGVLSGLKDNQPEAAKGALWDSGWASSHYGYGSRWSNSPVPGHASALSGGGGAGVPAPDPNGTWFLNPVLGVILHVTNHWQRDALKIAGSWVPYATQAAAEQAKADIGKKEHSLEGAAGSAVGNQVASGLETGLKDVFGNLFSAGSITKYLLEATAAAGGVVLVIWGVSRATGAGKAAETVVNNVQETGKKVGEVAAVAAA